MNTIAHHGTRHVSRRLYQGLRAAFLGLAIATLCGNALAHKCLYVSSYHKGYEWNDGIEKGIADVLEGRCLLDKFYLDTKRNKSPAFARKMALAAREHIEATRPDVVIACDDNASKYLVEPYYKDANLPIVFCGINWSAKDYGYPYSNATGMVEISPIKPLVRAVKSTIATVKHGVFVGPDVVTAHKEFELNREEYAEHGIQLTAMLVKDMDGWEQAYRSAQKTDFVVLASNGGINDWDDERASRVTRDSMRVFTVTNYDWMIPYALLAVSKLPEEQGEWAAKVALAILDGESPQNIPIVFNRKWNLYINTQMLEKTGIELPAHILHKAVKYNRE